MIKYTFYVDTISGDIYTIEDLRADYEGMDLESLPDGFKPIELNCDGDFSQTGRLFNSCFNNVKQGEVYIDEWSAYAEDSEGGQYKIIYRFAVTKGDEPSDEDLPWDSEGNIWSIERID